MQISEKIKALCAKESLSLLGLEKKMGFGNGTLRRWDTSVPSGDKLLKVAEYFGVSVDYLLGKEDIITTSSGQYTNIPLDAETFQLMSQIPLLNKTNKTLLADIIKSMLKNQE
jgi:transcriptional regulator with XRE-family HTH domain